MTKYDWQDGMHGADVATAASLGETLFAMALRLSQDTANRVEAHMYFNLADGMGVEDAAYHRATMAELMSKAEIGRALRAARAWLATSAA